MLLQGGIAADGANIILDAIFIFACRMGVSGAAIAHVLSQYLMTFILLWRLTKQVDLLPPSLKDLQFGRFLKNGFYLFTRVIAVTFCVTLAASLAARLGATQMAAFQICLQVWLTSSLLADGLAIAGQAILACAFAEKDYEKATTAASRVLQALSAGIFPYVLKLLQTITPELGQILVFIWTKILALDKQRVQWWQWFSGGNGAGADSSAGIGFALLLAVTGRVAGPFHCYCYHVCECGMQ